MGVPLEQMVITDSITQLNNAPNTLSPLPTGAGRKKVSREIEEVFQFCRIISYIITTFGKKGFISKITSCFFKLDNQFQIFVTGCDNSLIIDIDAETTVETLKTIIQASLFIFGVYCLTKIKDRTGIPVQGLAGNLF